MAEPTVREVLQSAIEEHREEPVAETQSVEAAHVETDEQRAERLRDEKGRFAKSETDKSSAPAIKGAAASPPASAPATQDAVQVAEPELKPIQRPSSWKKEMWPIWDKMAAGQPLSPQEARQVAEYNANREQQFASGVSTYKQEAERAKPLMEAIAPFQQDLDKYGVNAAQMVHSLMSAHRMLSLGSPQEKLHHLTKIIEGYGVPIAALYDPNVQQQYLNSAPRQMAPVQQAPQAQPDINSLVEQALQEREVKQTVSSMASNTEKYPFFPYVRNTMAQLLETGATTDLDEAYRMALDSPEHAMLSTAMQQQQVQADQARELEAKKTVARVARSNAISPKSATPATNGTPSGKPSVRESLREALATHVGSARV